MGKGNYQNTKIAVVSVDDLDGETASAPEERNILREKTFNSELNSLVNKIFSNEKLGEGQYPSAEEETDSLEKISLLRKCESYIYRLKHAEDLKSVSSTYDPFDTDIDVYDDIDDTADYIKAGLWQCGYTGFQILKYNFYDKSFRSDINLLKQSYSSDIFFSTNDQLFMYIKDHPEGFILSAESIKSDPFMAKKFLSDVSGDFTPRPFYIIKISSLFERSADSRSFENNLSRFETFLSPLLLIELTPGDAVKPDEIFRRLKKSASLPLLLYFLKNRFKHNINTYSHTDTLLMIEIFIKSAINSKLKSYLITLKDYSSKENIFILKFILSKIRRILKRKSLILRVSINSIVVITSSDISDIYNLIERVNSGTKIVEIHTIDYNAYLNSKEFVNLFL